ncbi:MAG: GWxTD domain-containing protein [Balneolaceae bacterium]|nr:GWxTD domain-containing protein [Balneolaceae bacterium]
MTYLNQYYHTLFGKTSLFCLAVFIGLSCARSANPDIERGSDYEYRPGYPEVRFSAVGFLNEDNQPSINLAADIVYGSLIFKEFEGTQQAQIGIDVRIVKKETDDNVIDSKHYDIEIKKEDSSITTSQKSFIFEKRIDVPAGSYTVYFTLTDKNSGKKITRSTDTSIPDPTNNQIDLTDIRMLGKDMDADSPDWFPITTYDVPGRIDSLMFIFQATNNSSDQPLTISAELLRFESDQSIARPMYFNNYSPSSIQYKGIDFDEETVIRQSQRKLLEPGSVFIEFRFARQERGNYRFEVRSDKEEDQLFKARDFGVKSENYPAIKTARELARPLAYLMDEGEYEDLMAISDSDSLKQAIDRFWLREIGNKNEAISVLKLYYQRVEEANKQFSNFKEGWKTDTGMIYILFGPPWYVNNQLDEMVWSYSYNRDDPSYNYLFFQPKIQSEFYPFEHYILQRNQQYYSVEFQQVSLWLSGLILTRNV